MKLGRLWIITLTELKRICNDRRNLVIQILGPVLVCIIFGLVAYRSPQEIDVAVFVDQFHRSSAFAHEETQRIMADIDSSESFAVTEVYSLDDAMQRMYAGDSRAVVALEEGETSLQAIHVTIDVTHVIVQEAIAEELPPILEKYSRSTSTEFLSAAGMPPQQITRIFEPLGIDITTDAIEDIEYFDYYASAITVLIILGIALLLTVTAITSERFSGTIERIFASPYTTSEFVLSKLLARSVFALMVTVLVLLTLKLAFDILLGNILLVLVIATLAGINAVSIGLLVSAVTYSQEESSMAGTIVYLLFIILMTFIWPFETMHPSMKLLPYLVPFTYSIQAIRRVNLLGCGLADIWPELIISMVFVVAYFAITVRVLRREIR